MKKNNQPFFHRIFILVIAALCGIWPAEIYAEKISGPSAMIHNTRAEFNPVLEGTVVMHEFIIANEGDSVLRIFKIETGCGCTTVDYSREIQPSATGRIVVNADTTGYGGSIFMETITVFSNDPLKEKILLDLSGTVKEFADIFPQRLMLKGSVNDDVQARVIITQKPEYQFGIEKVESVNLEESIEVSVDKKDNGYVITVKSRQKNPGIYAGKILVITGHPEKPELEIPVMLALTP